MILLGPQEQYPLSTQIEAHEHKVTGNSLIIYY